MKASVAVDSLLMLLIVIKSFNRLTAPPMTMLNGYWISGYSRVLQGVIFQYYYITKLNEMTPFYRDGINGRLMKRADRCFSKVVINYFKEV